jgi:hypothetical protein
VLQERSRLLGVIAAHFGTALRKIHAADSADDTTETRRLLLSLEALERLRTSLERGVQEGLALEAGFLELMITFGAE